MPFVKKTSATADLDVALSADQCLVASGPPHFLTARSGRSAIAFRK